MRASYELLAQARGGGTPLEGREAIVQQADDSGPASVWLGFQSDGLATAYFQDETADATAFAISAAITVERVTVRSEHDASAVGTIKLTCHDAPLNRVFCGFVDEVRERLSAGATAADVIRSSASEWRSLLQVATRPLSENGAAGIFGELRFLEEAVRELGPSALELWQRAPQDMHDFTADAARVEVKTSAFQDRSAITVHGLRQLEPPADGTLTLAVAEVQKHGDDSIGAAVSRLRGAGVTGDVLAGKLAAAGYVDGMPGAEDFTFALRSWRYWEIDGRANVLNVSALDPSIADSVSSLSYALSLSALGEAAETFDFNRFAPTGGSAA